MKLMITGGAGFIGSHLCDKYVHEGHEVLCLDNFLNGNLINIRHLLNFRNFKLFKGDIRDSEFLEKVMKDVDVIFHLAAQIHVDRSYIEPQLTYETNVMGTQNILEMARLYDIKRTIYASTSEVYGSALQVPINEKHPLNAPHPYGASKIAADRMCYSYMRTYGMDIAVLRFFNIFGPRQRDFGYGGVISIFTRRILNNTPPIIYGDGTQTRDYTYIKDAVNAYDLTLNHDCAIREPLNFGTGTEVSINEIANKIISIFGKNGILAPTHIESRIGEVERLIADFSEAKKVLGWEPSVSFDQGLNEFAKWYQAYGCEGGIRFE
jgi:UDP-glucose 4-epimerase